MAYLSDELFISLGNPMAVMDMEKKINPSAEK